MDKETIFEKYRKAGTIAKAARERAVKLAKPGTKILDLVEAIESYILAEKGAELAFPFNVSANDFAAHDTADFNDQRVLGKGDVVKLDVGVHVDGYIADTAVTVCVGGGGGTKNDPGPKLKLAAESALDVGLKMMTPGRKVNEVSEAIENAIKSSGFNPIVNLTGHGLDQYDLHARIEFPNVKTELDYELKEGEVFALEPFVTDGSGKVKESDRVLIYHHQSSQPTRFRESVKILELAQSRYNGLPFARRWLSRSVPAFKLNLIIRQLVANHSLYPYPVLREVSGGTVAQAEHTVIVGNPPEVTTK